MILSYCCRARATLEDKVGSSCYLEVHHGITVCKWLKCSHIGAILPYFYIADFCTPAINPQHQRVLGFNLWVGDGGAFFAGVENRNNMLQETAVGLQSWVNDI